MTQNRTFKIRKTMKVPRSQDQLHEIVNLNDIEPNLKSTDNLQTHIPSDPPFIVATYENESPNCNRFPHSAFCGCLEPCILESFKAYHVSEDLFFGDFVSGLKARDLLEISITHVLNITAKQYTKMNKYFIYQHIDLYDNTEEDVKKFFRFSNRFIKNAIERKGKVFIHCNSLQLGAIFALAYMIGVKKIQLKQALKIVLNKTNIQISPHFMRQIQSYDLQKIAFVSIQRE